MFMAIVAFNTKKKLLQYFIKHKRGKKFTNERILFFHMEKSNIKSPLKNQYHNFYHMNSLASLTIKCYLHISKYPQRAVYCIQRALRGNF